MRKNINYTTQEEPTFFERLKKLNELERIIKSDLDDYQKAILIRRIYKTGVDFKKAFYYSTYSLKNKTITYTLDDIFARQEELIVEIERIYSEYEKSGLLETAKKNDKYLLRNAGNIDVRDVIVNYINDDTSYDLETFLHKYRISAKDFDIAVARVKRNANDLYEEYLKTVDINRVKKLVVPMYNVFQILEGINSGKTIEGNKFDKLEFYKLIPFKGKDFDLEIRKLSRDYPKISIFKKYKQEYKSLEENKTRPINYADNLYLFTRCFTSKNNAEILKNWMTENNVKNLTPIFRSATVKCYSDGSEEEFFSSDDANEMFDIMDENNYPKIYEVYNLLKEERIKSKKLIKENK